MFSGTVLGLDLLSKLHQTCKVRTEANVPWLLNRQTFLKPYSDTGCEMVPVPKMMCNTNKMATYIQVNKMYILSLHITY